MKKLIILIGIVLLLSSCSSTNSFKEYIIEHNYDIVLVEKQSLINETIYTLKCDDLSYYTDVIIVMYDNTHYKIIMWGNRNSLFWNFKKDNVISVDIIDSIYFNKDVRNGYIIINILNTIKNNPKIKIFS